MTKKIEIHYKRNHDGLYSYATCDVSHGEYRVLYTYRTQGEILSPGTVWTDKSLADSGSISDVKIMEV